MTEQENQIEEMLNDLFEFEFGVNKLVLVDFLNGYVIDELAEHLIAKGYRKVVMCKDCEYCTNYVPTRLLCTYYGENVSEKHYCSNAKMKGAE